jgi:hypothetical protein
MAPVLAAAEARQLRQPIHKTPSGTAGIILYTDSKDDSGSGKDDSGTDDSDNERPLSLADMCAAAQLL